MSYLTSLYLAPNDPFTSPEKAPILDLLARMEITAAALDESTFAAGAGFPHHVVFAGCSPHLVMQPPADGSRQFCHVAVHGPFSTPRLVTGPNTVKPRCPQCRARFDDWRGQLEAWQKGDRQAHCRACHTDWTAVRLDWRRHAIGGRLLIELRNVYPGEASPSDLLLHELEQTGGLPWQYAWAGYLDR
ncbi:MAG: hypothetical protein KDI82_03375 [Gammaproteobacteria bacterium]|nr:hypothetical protein [Gammaproteobacteria bacterium]